MSHTYDTVMCLDCCAMNQVQGIVVLDRFVKDGSSVISKRLMYIMNLFINTGSIPDDLKMARVIPLHKKKCKTDAGNYRSISVLSAKCLKKLFSIN